MGQAVPVDDLPGSLVPETDLPVAGVAESDLFKSGQPGVPSTNPPVPGMPAPQFYPVGPGANMPAGVGQFARDVGTIAQPIGQFAKQYASKPGLAVMDLAAGSMLGAPPKATVEGAQALGETYKNATNYLNKTGQFAPPPTAPAGAVTNELANAAKISQAIGPEGLASGMRPGGSFPTTVPTPPVAGGPAAQEGSTFISRMAEKFAPMAARVAPVLNTVGRVAGPAGLALNAYEGAKFAQEAELGKRLAEGQGRVAQHAFRNMNTQYGAPISREQALAVLQSGNPRDIAAFGGEQHLRQLAQ
jgi:hypothetical protein